MKIALCYICVTNGRITADYAARFVTSYREYGPGAEHDTFIICNGGPLRLEESVIFSGMNVHMYPRINDPGWDVTAYIDAAKGPCRDYDAMFCCGESVYFHTAGWLKRLQEAWQRYGPGFYGPFSSNAVRAHLNTTAFFCAPLLLRQYPVRINGRKERMEFEHGERSIWRRVSRRGMPVKLVTWDGEWSPEMWRMPKNILWRGDQSNCLVWCNHVDGFANAEASTKERWAKISDRPFQ